jgi:hypothetical protein
MCPISRRPVLSIAFTFILIAGTAATARAQVIITVNDDVNMKFGVLGQFQADTIDDPTADAQTKNLFVRRLRLLFGGQVAKNVTFFVETDTPNLGKTLPTGKNITPSVIVQDAYGEFKAVDEFSLDAGLMYIPFSRNSLQSAATLLPIDYGPNTFAQSGPTQSATGRDTGFQAKGYFLENHLEYRVGAFQGVRDAPSHNAFRYAGRVQYDVFDTETGFFYTGTYLGKKKILAVGAAFDVQKDYHGYDVDAFADFPFGQDAITGQFDFNRFDGGTTFRTLPKQNDVLVEVGYLVRALNLTPVVQFAHRDVSSASTGDEKRTSVGVNYWWAGHNANVKAAYTRIDPARLASQNEWTLQLQLFYF